MNSKKIMLITGASSEIGVSVIKHYMQMDEYVIVAHYNSNNEELMSLQKESRLSNLHLVQCDLSNEAQLLEMNKQIKMKFEKIDIFLHLPSPKMYMKRLKDLKWENFQAHIDVQVKSAHVILSEFLPGMAQRKEGNIIFVLTSAILGAPPTAATDYVVSKYALLGYMKCLVKEFTAKKIRINAVSPSMMETKFISGIPDVAVGLNRENHPLKRLASVEDVSSTIQFLVSESSSYMTGVNIPVTGGEVF